MDDECDMEDGPKRGAPGKPVPPSRSPKRGKQDIGAYLRLKKKNGPKPSGAKPSKKQE